MTPVLVGRWRLLAGVVLGVTFGACGLWWHEWQFWLALFVSGVVAEAAYEVGLRETAYDEGRAT